MDIFKKDDKKTVNIKQPKNIKTKQITKKYNLMDTSCTISIKDAKFGEVDNKEILLDEFLVGNMLEGIIKVIRDNCSKYNSVPSKIVISHSDSNLPEKDHDEENNKTLDENKDDFINSYKPRWNFDDVYIEEYSKKQIVTALTMSKYKEKLFDEWGLKGSMKSGRAIAFNFWGPPGTGKSVTAEAIASYLNKEVFSVNYAELESKYVGETPKNIKKAFERARENNAVLVFDEADSFLGKRLTNVSQSADYGVNITRSVMLLELEKFDGVVIFTTNLVSNYDEAFKRRILASVEFKLPDEKGRKAIWKMHLPEKLPLQEDVSIEYLASKYSEVSGADIKDIVLYAAVICLQRGEGEVVNHDDFNNAYNYVISRYKEDKGLQISHEVISEEQYEKETSNIKVEKLDS